MTKSKFTIWLEKLERIVRTNDELNKVLKAIAKKSWPETQKAMFLSLTRKDIGLLKNIENKKELQTRTEDLFEMRTGISSKELRENVQLLLIENSVYIGIPEKRL